MNQTQTVENLESIRFKGYTRIEPEDLVVFSIEYQKHREILASCLREKNGKIMSLSIFRMKNNGEIDRHDETGTIRNVSTHGFFFDTGEDESNERFISFFNVLGEVPALQFVSKDFDPYEVNTSDNIKSYFPKLEEIRNLMEKTIGLEGYMRLFFRYDKSHKLYREGGFYVDCKIGKVNRSNVEVKHFRSLSYIDHDNKFCDLSNGHRVLRFVTPYCYLYGGTYFNNECKINPFDEDD